MNIMTRFHLIFVHLIDSKFAHCDDKAESTDDKNDDGNEATMEILVTFIIAQYVRLHSDPYPGNLFPTLPNITVQQLLNQLNMFTQNSTPGNMVEYWKSLEFKVTILFTDFNVVRVG